MNHIVPCVFTQVDDAQRRVLQPQFIRRDAFRQRLLHQHALVVPLFLIHDADRTVVDLGGNHRIVIPVKISQQDFRILAAGEQNHFAGADFRIVGNADGLVPVRSDHRAAHDVVLGIGNNGLALPPVEGAIGFQAFTVGQEVILALLKADLVNQARVHPPGDEVRRFLEAVVLDAVRHFAVHQHPVLQVVVQTEHAVQVALVALPVVVHEAQRPFVVCLAVSVHIMIPEIGQDFFHLAALQRQAVLQLIRRQVADRAGFNRFLRPGNVQEQQVRALQQAHLFNSGQGVDLSVLHVQQLVPDIRPLLQQFGEIRHILQVIADRYQHLALGIFDDFTGTHARVIDRVRTVVLVAEDQVLLLGVNGFGYVFPVDLHIGLGEQVSHNLHIVVILRAGVLGRIHPEGDVLRALFVQDRSGSVLPLESIVVHQGISGSGRRRGSGFFLLLLSRCGSSLFLLFLSRCGSSLLLLFCGSRILVASAAGRHGNHQDSHHQDNQPFFQVFFHFVFLLINPSGSRS